MHKDMLYKENEHGGRYIKYLCNNDIFKNAGYNLIYSYILTDCLKRPTDAMPEYIMNNGLNVLWSNIASPPENRHNFRGLYKCDRGTWRSSEVNEIDTISITELGRVSRCKDDICHIFVDLLIHMHFFCDAFLDTQNIRLGKYLIDR